MKKVPILILHGWNLSKGKYAPLIKELEKNKYHTLSLDLPGFGKNIRVDHPYTIEDYGCYVISYLKKRKIKEIVLIGHSFGGRIGIYLSINSPQFIKGLILSGTPGLEKDLTLKESIYLLLAKTGKIFFSVPPFDSAADFARKLLYKIVGSYDYYHSKGTLRETFINIVSYRLEPLLVKIKIPTIIIWGREDRIVPVKVAFGMNRFIAGSTLYIIKNARHAVPWTHPVEFASKVEEFINRL